MAPKAAAAKGEKKPKKTQPEAAEDESEKVKAPDRTVFDEKLAKVAKEIEELQVKQKALSTQIGDRSSGKEEFFAKKAEIGKRLDDVSQRWNDMKAQKDEIMGQLKGKREEGIAMRSELNKLKKDMPYTSEEQIRDRIHAIEQQMVTESVTLKEEKRMMEEIKNLKKSTAKVSQYSDMESKVKEAASDSNLSLKERLDGINGHLTAIMEEKKKVHEEYGELMKQRTEQMGDMPQLFENREDLNKQIQAKIRERNEIRDAFREEERTFNAYLAEQRAARAAQARDAREKRNEEYEQDRRRREADKLEEQPHIAEVTLLEQTIKFCKSLMPKEESVKEEKKQVDLSSAEGHTVILSKDKREEEFYFAPLKVKNKGGKKNAKAASSKMIKHNAETFRLFDQLKVEAPITTDDLEKTLQNLEAQLADYNNKIKEWETNRDMMRQKILAGEVTSAEKAQSGDVEE